MAQLNTGPHRTPPPVRYVEATAGEAPHRTQAMTASTVTFDPATTTISAAASPDVTTRQDGRWVYAGWTLLTTAPQELIVAADERVMEHPRTGERRIVKLNGRTRQAGHRGRLACCDYFDIETVVRMSGDTPVLWGIRGERLGSCYIPLWAVELG